MPECAKCKASVPTHAKVCPKCGAPAGVSARLLSAPSLDPDDNVHSLLLNAHLLKIRDDSEAAITECIKALRINPDSLEAHTLLGDIYRSQGKVEEAVHWYKLALDLNPGNRSNLERLDQMSTHRKPAFSKPAGFEVGEGNPSPKSSSAFNPVIAIVVTICLLGLAMSVLLVKQRSHPTTTFSSQNQPANAPTPVAASAFQQPEGQQPVSQPDEPKIEVTVGSGLPQTSDPDSTIVRGLNDASELKTARLQIVSSTYDPRSDVQHITFVNPDIEGGFSRNTIIQHSLVVAKTAFAREQGLTQVTVRALYRLPSENGAQLSTVFVGDITGEKASHIEPASAPSTDQNVFENEWWSSEIK